MFCTFDPLTPKKKVRKINIKVSRNNKDYSHLYSHKRKPIPWKRKSKKSICCFTFALKKRPYGYNNKWKNIKIMAKKS